jgi:hypothetical protein
MIKTLFDSGHTLIDNNVGDLDLVCPFERQTLFVPAMIGITLTNKTKCPICGSQLGIRIKDNDYGSNSVD